mmetsp:Transcript_58968/g.127580  ORF Transcript_58968/g.127580 Transcript_58968/m.127580 type:complete len:460 (-) Transcript_58968:51-1430(-)|eukprot:CAMPEP_0170602112 /NCGR_PEP_ID=MMETSP0224-20130122/18220_1 /TAXON_ID=285029 /ORGANISM="Togula jolla, Strain CCCM 725" /LENGTH=459 /DNA_ID=CAMNT_0010926935 /DNA_START=58 /DNA_END=1437 /DNA_ORIENTATION=+
MGERGRSGQQESWSRKQDSWNSDWGGRSKSDWNSTGSWKDNSWKGWKRPGDQSGDWGGNDKRGRWQDASADETAQQASIQQVSSTNAGIPTAFPGQDGRIPATPADALSAAQYSQGYVASEGPRAVSGASGFIPSTPAAAFGAAAPGTPAAAFHQAQRSASGFIPSTPSMAFGAAPGTPAAAFSQARLIPGTPGAVLDQAGYGHLMQAPGTPGLAQVPGTPAMGWGGRDPAGIPATPAGIPGTPAGAAHYGPGAPGAYAQGAHVSYPPSTGLATPNPRAMVPQMAVAAAPRRDRPKVPIFSDGSSVPLRHAPRKGFGPGNKTPGAPGTPARPAPGTPSFPSWRKDAEPAEEDPEDSLDSFNAWRKKRRSSGTKKPLEDAKSTTAALDPRRSAAPDGDQTPRIPMNDDTPLLPCPHDILADGRLGEDETPQLADTVFVGQTPTPETSVTNGSGDKTPRLD